MVTSFFDWFRAFNRESVVSSSARAVGNAMATRANSETLEFWVTIQEIAEFTRLSPRHVIRMTDELNESEWIVRRCRGAFGRASEYTLSLPHGDTHVTHMVTPVSVHGDTHVTPTTPKLPLEATPKTTPIVNRGGKRRSYDERFQKFWKAYPRKKGDKQRTQKLFFEQLEEVTAEELIRLAEKYAKQIKGENTAMRFVPYPSTWLSQQRWMEVRDFSTPQTKTDSINADYGHMYRIMEEAPF